MNIATGDTYETKADALGAGVPASDIAEVVRHDDRVPVVRFASGPFKDRVYKRTPGGQLVRVAGVLAIAGLLSVGCVDLNPLAPSLTSQALGMCQTAGSTVGILDQAPGC